jgi:hypothetical protein
MCTCEPNFSCICANFCCIRADFCCGQCRQNLLCTASMGPDESYLRGFLGLLFGVEGRAWPFSLLLYTACTGCATYHLCAVVKAGCWRI